jgi:hypothetical protein
VGTAAAAGEMAPFNADVAHIPTAKKKKWFARGQISRMSITERNLA